MDETRIEKRESESGEWTMPELIPSAPADPNATQRVDLTGDGTPVPAPRPARSPRDTANRQKQQNEQRASAAAKRKQQRIAIIALSAVAAVLIIALVVVLLTSALKNTNDDDRIANNIFVAGVDLGGMTIEEAKIALQQETINTYNQIPMTVQVLDNIITLSPVATGAKLDVDKAVQAAYDCSRNGTREGTGAYTVSVLPYLSLNTNYIREEVNKLGKQYSTTLSQSTYTIEGSAPSTEPDPETMDLTHVYQTLYITIGTPEYGLNTDKLYEQIMDAYNINIFHVTGECSVVSPDELDYQLIFDSFCREPVDAVIDPTTNAILEKEIYGYGFTLADLKAKVAEAKPGETVPLELTYIEPNYTSAMHSKDYYSDVLVEFTTTTPDDYGWKTNLGLAIQKIHGYILMPGNEFSFNRVVGEPTTRGGYKNVNMYVGKQYTTVVGGGLSQLASNLYYCALRSDLNILERNSHAYCPSYIIPGFDAQIYYGSMDMRFTNNMDHPIRIEAYLSGAQLTVRLIGTARKDYTTQISSEITDTRKPGTDIVVLPAGEADDYVDGQVLSEGITGYTVKVTRTIYDKTTGRKMSADVIYESYYAKKNVVIVQLREDTPPETEPSEPDASEPSEPSDPSASEPSAPVENPSEGNEAA